YAMFDGPASPATQTFGLGIAQLPADEDLDRIEAFFVERGAPVHHEVSPLADDKLVPMLTARGYRPFEFTSVMYRPISVARLGARQSRPAAVTVRQVEADDLDVFARTSAAGWSH